MVYNLWKSVHIKKTCHPFNLIAYFTTCRKGKNGLKFVTFSSFQLFEHVICHFIRLYTTFYMVHYGKRLFITMKK